MIGMSPFSCWMEEASLTDQSVSNLTGIHRTIVSRIRRGERRPSDKTLESLMAFSISEWKAGRAPRPLRPNDFFTLRVRLWDELGRTE